MTDLEHEILLRVLWNDVDVIYSNFLVGFLAFQVFALDVHYDEVVIEPTSVVKQHRQEKVVRLVSLSLVTSLLSKLFRLELEIAVVACCKQVLPADVVVMTHFGICHSERFLAALTVGGSAEIFLLFFGEWQHVHLLVQDVAYDLAFIHYVVIELAHGVRATVHERRGLVLRVLRHSIYTEPGHLVTVDYFGIALAVVLYWWCESLKVRHEQKRHLVLLVSRMKLKCGVAFVRIPNLLRVVSRTVWGVIVEGRFGAERMQTRDADVRGVLMVSSV